jgi:hypothetical protein
MFSIPMSWYQHVFSKSRVLSRLFRLGAQHLVRMSDDVLILFAAGSIYCLEIESRRVRRTATVHGSRPLAVAVCDGNIYYGEYRGNPERSPVCIWRGDGTAEGWDCAWQFDSVRHIHGVFNDPYSDRIWVTTGDLDDESIIWVTRDGFKSLHRVVGGSQSTRAVTLLFTPTHIYFGTDAPDEQNKLRRIARDTHVVEDLFDVDGPVFFGSCVGGWICFSTACEPSEVNDIRYVRVYASRDGRNWEVLFDSKKDIWSMKYFQYGQAFFPRADVSSNQLWLSLVATQHDGYSMRLNLGDGR